jgi:hypothetical protein
MLASCGPRAATGTTNTHYVGTSATLAERLDPPKEKLRQTVEELSEAEAQDALGFIVRRRGKRDALAELLERVPLDDEPTTPEEDEGAREAKEQIVRGDGLSADEIRRELA